MSQESRERLDRCLDVALDNRKFEIELLWKRNTAFWLFVAAIAAAVGATLKDHRVLATALSIAGCLSSYIWYLVNLSSKAWQTSWEVKAEHYLLQRHREGNLFIRWTEDNSRSLGHEPPFYQPPPRYSVSGLLIALSLYLTLFWAAVSAYLLLIRIIPLGWSNALRVVAIVLFILFSLYWGRYRVWAESRRPHPEEKDKFVVVHHKRVCHDCSQFWH